MRIFFLLLLTSFLLSCEGEPNTEYVEKYEAPPEVVSEPDSLLRHIVLFSWKAESSPEDIQGVTDAFAALETKIPEIYAYEAGLNNSPEGLNKGLTHCFLVTFESEADRAVYLPHPDHQTFVDMIGPHVQDVLVVDYWAK